MRLANLKTIGRRSVPTDAQSRKQSAVDRAEAKALAEKVRAREAAEKEAIEATERERLAKIREAAIAGDPWLSVTIERVQEPSAIRRGRLAVDPKFYVTDPDGAVWRFHRQKDARAFITAHGCAEHENLYSCCSLCGGRLVEKDGSPW